MGNKKKKRRRGNYGHPIDEDTRRKISESVKKRWQDKTYQDKVSKAHSHKLSDEWKENISKGMTGMKKSKETRKKMSKAQRNKSKQTLEKQSRNWKRQWSTLTKEQQLERLSAWIEAGHKALRNNKNSWLKPSSIEIKVQEQLDMLGIRYVQQKYINDGERGYFLDFYIPSKKLVIEVNGSYWHSFSNRIERDWFLEEYVKSTGRDIIFIWEQEINDEWFWIGDYIGV